MKLKGFYNIDCMEGMKNIPDKYFDLAIVDPPYFKGPNVRGFYGRRINKLNIKRHDYKNIDTWNIPDKKYFKELLRVSKNQIIWGINYFDINLGPGRIIWDKVNGSSSYSDCEIAYCSLYDSVRIFRYMWNGMNQGKSISEGWIMQGNKKLNEKRIHPTQKPVLLYKWLLMSYAKSGYRILDTHVGSASSLIACHDLGYEYLGFEKDKDIFILASNRLKEHESQISMFNMIN